MTPDAAAQKHGYRGQSGAIGVEFAYFYRTMGTEVTLVEYLPRIVPVEDEEVSRQMEKSYRKLGITILTSAEVTKPWTPAARAARCSSKRPKASRQSSLRRGAERRGCAPPTSKTWASKSWALQGGKRPRGGR